MLTKHKPSRLVVALLLAGMPILGFSADVVVAPPTPPKGVQAIKDSEPKDASAAVIAPAAVAGLRAEASGAPAVGAGGDGVRAPKGPELVLPPAPAAEDVKDLVPPPVKVPAKAKVKEKTSQKQEAARSAAPAKAAPEAKPSAPAVVDPFAGLTMTPVSDSQLNRFVFPEKVEGVYFPEGAPLPTCAEDAHQNDPCKPVFLNNRQMMLLQLKAGAKGPLQMLVHLHSGRVVTLNLAPGHGPGSVVRIEGAEDGVSDARIAQQQQAEAARKAKTPTANEGESQVDLLSRFAKGQVPAGFEPVKVGAPTQFIHFEVRPMASWSNGSGLRAHVMQVHAYDDTPVTINPGLFRAQNVKGVALDREVATAEEPATLYIIEKVAE